MIAVEPQCRFAACTAGSEVLGPLLPVCVQNGCGTVNPVSRRCAGAWSQRKNPSTIRRYANATRKLFVSLAVKDIAVSRTFYEKLGMEIRFLSTSMCRARGRDVIGLDV